MLRSNFGTCGSVTSIPLLPLVIFSQMVTIFSGMLTLLGLVFLRKIKKDAKLSQHDNNHENYGTTWKSVTRPFKWVPMSWGSYVIWKFWFISNSDLWWSKETTVLGGFTIIWIKISEATQGNRHERFVNVSGVNKMATLSLRSLWNILDVTIIAKFYLDLTCSFICPISLLIS